MNFLHSDCNFRSKGGGLLIIYVGLVFHSHLYLSLATRDCNMVTAQDCWAISKSYNKIKVLCTCLQIEQSKCHGFQLINFTHTQAHIKNAAVKCSLVTFEKGSDCKMLIKATIMGKIKDSSTPTSCVRQWPIVDARIN